MIRRHAFVFAGLLGAVLALVVAACGAEGSPTPSTAGDLAATSTTTSGSGTGPSGCPTSQPAPLAPGDKRTVTIETPKGTISVVVEADLSPIAAGNFVALASCGWYDGVVFHRLVPGFVIQGGDGKFGRVGADGKLAADDAAQAGTGGPGYTIQDEPVTGGYGRGVVAMARTSAPNSVGSQFFVVLDDGASDALARYNTYQIIGHVTSGMDVVDVIAAMPNSGPDTGNAALEPVPMTTVTVSP